MCIGTRNSGNTLHIGHMPQAPVQTGQEGVSQHGRTTRTHVLLSEPLQMLSLGGCWSALLLSSKILLRNVHCAL